MKILLAILFLLASPARADILFFDLNFSPKEVTAAQAAAKARGERLHVFPERTPEQHREIERRYLLVIDVQAKLRACLNAGKKCDELSKRFNEAWERLQESVGWLQRVDGQEATRILNGLEAAGAKLSTVIFSGHSGGDGSFGGFLGALHVDMVKESFRQHPRLLTGIDTMLFWGCYSGTLHSMHSIWRAAFPEVSVFGGFENQSPLGIRESSGRFLKSFLLNERRMAAAKEMREIHRIFRSLDLVAQLDGTALVGRYYFTYEHADDVDEMFGRCQRFDPSLMESFECYENGQLGCESPPVDRRGPLRALYSFLQVNRHCTAKIRERFPGLPSAEYLVRLIFLDEVKKNFDAHHRARFTDHDAHLAEARFPAALKAENFVTSSRQADVARFGLADHLFEQGGMRDYSVVDRPDSREILLAARLQNSMRNMLGPSSYRTVPASCVPFSWVEPDAQERDSCGFADLALWPTPERTKVSLANDFYYWRTKQFLAEKDPSVHPWMQPVFGTLAELKGSSLPHIRAAIARLEGFADRSNSEERRLAVYRSLLAEGDAMSERELAARMLASLEEASAFTRAEISRANLDPNGLEAAISLERFLENYQSFAEAIRRLL